MKRAKIAVVVALVALVSGFQANARLAFGVKAGLNVNKMHLNHDELLDGSNRAGDRPWCGSLSDVYPHEQ